jgi:hypothetical protein
MNDYKDLEQNKLSQYRVKYFDVRDVRVWAVR